MNMDALIHSAKTLFNIHLTGTQVIALANYERELIEWNQKFNLTAIRDSESIRVKHFLDSFSCVLAWNEIHPLRLIDVGTGAGFPGIPLKIIYPSMHLTLVESVGKKVSFCNHLVSTLRLENVQVLNARAEDVGQDSAHRETYDWAVARAVARMNILAEYLLPLVKIGGQALAQKGESAPDEIIEAENSFAVLGGKFNRLIPVQLPEVADQRYLVLMDKVSATDSKYPRNSGIPAKMPL